MPAPAPCPVVDVVTGTGTLRGRDVVLEIENDGVGAVSPVLECVGASSGYQQPRTRVRGGSRVVRQTGRMGVHDGDDLSSGGWERAFGSADHSPQLARCN